jgi:peroxiredoxin
VCNSELRSIQKNLEAFHQAGINPIAISVDKPEDSRKLAQSAGYTFPLLSDQKREVITRYDLVHKGGGPVGEDISRPAEFLLDSTGTVRWRMLTENYWRRATPEQIMEAAKVLQ